MRDLSLSRRSVLLIGMHFVGTIEVMRPMVQKSAHDIRPQVRLNVDIHGMFSYSLFDKDSHALKLEPLALTTCTRSEPTTSHKSGINIDNGGMTDTVH